MFARAIVNRKWMVAAGVAAILALVIGAAVGRSIIPSDAKKRTVTTPAPVRFADRVVGLSLSYPAGWTRLASKDPQVRLVAAASPTTSLSLRVSPSKLADVTTRTLPIVRQFTDDLVAADTRAKVVAPAQPVVLGGLPGYRYSYTYTTTGGTPGAHIHYFLFKHRRLVQLVFQSLPADDLSKDEPTFNRIASTLRSTKR